MPRKIQNSVVVITGASSGIGRAAALEFARKGANLVLGARNETALRDAAAECGWLGGRAVVVPTDVTDKKAVQNLARQAIENFGRLDVWVNCAAVTLFARFEEASLESYRQVIETNLFGCIHGARAALPYFHEQGSGVLINVSSVVAKTPQPYTSAYDITKSGIWALSQSLREEFMLDGGDIHVCTVLPATIDTPIFQHAANYTGRAVRAMPPVHSAEQVARAIAKCAEHPRREVSVGGAGIMLKGLHAVAPNLTERLMAMQVDRKHLTDQPAGPTPGNLFAPMPEWDRVSGGWQKPARSTARNVLVGGVVAAAASAGWLLLRQRSRKRAAAKPWKLAQSGVKAGRNNNWLALIGAGIGLMVAGRALWRQLRAIDLHGQVVLITGSSRGLGFALAQEFARQGARLVMCARNEQDLERARRDIEKLGAEVLAVPCDVSRREQVQWMVAQALTHFGRIDILVNNAGVVMVGPLQTQTLNDFEEALNTMFWSSVYTTLAVLPHMLPRKRGRIVNITSIGGKVSVPHLLSYNAAKFAAVGFSEGLHAEVAKEGIKVVTVVPGLMRTGSHVNALFKGKHTAEYTWFSLGASLPIAAMSARRAARRIVRAARVGETEVLLGWQPQIFGRLHGVLPGFMTNWLALDNRFMPKPGGIEQQRRTGNESETGVTRSFLTGLGRQAAHTYHQYDRDGQQAPEVAETRR
ncbi:MAG TPA: SDR family oxidoreductase [Ktedonobacterales bacterium]|jgi:short-subunit dehydrogenase